LLSPTIISSSWIVQGPGSFTASGSGLNAAFTPAGCGSGTAHFITTWQHVCDAGQSTAYASGSFTVNCADACLVAGVSTNCAVSGSMALTNTTAATNFCFGSAVTASVASLITNAQIIITTTYTNAAGAVTTNCPPTFMTNSVAPTVVSNRWIASGPGSYTNSGAGLTASFTPTNGGSGQITFYLTYSNNAPCNPNLVTISTAALGFNVIQMTNFTVADFPTNHARTTIGVGEVVELGLAGIADGPFTWSTTAGTFGFDRTNGVFTTLTAPPRAATATVSVNYPGGSCNIPFMVVEPAVETAVIGVTNTYPAGKQGAGMKLDPITVGPTNVSFENVEVLEVPGPASSITGYFTNYPATNLVHQPNPNWIQLNNLNQWADSAAFWGYPKPWYQGGFQWVIPVQWRVVGTTNIGNLPNRLQVFSINGTNGSSTVSKLGQSVTRIP
jgi:hypothetical protein